MQAAPARRMWIVAADSPANDTAEEMLARREKSGTRDHFNGWIVGVYSSRDKALMEILMHHVGYTAHGIIPDVYVHTINKHAVVLKIIACDVDDANE